MYLFCVSVVNVSASFLAGEVEFDSDGGSHNVRCPRYAVVQVSRAWQHSIALTLPLVQAVCMTPLQLLSHTCPLCAVCTVSKWFTLCCFVVPPRQYATAPSLSIQVNNAAHTAHAAHFSQQTSFIATPTLPSVSLLTLGLCAAHAGFTSPIAVVRRLNNDTREDLVDLLSSTDCVLHPELYTLAIRFDNNS